MTSIKNRILFPSSLTTSDWVKTLLSFDRPDMFGIIRKSQLRGTSAYEWKCGLVWKLHVVCFFWKRCPKTIWAKRNMKESKYFSSKWKWFFFYILQHTSTTITHNKYTQITSIVFKPHWHSLHRTLQWGKKIVDLLGWNHSNLVESNFSTILVLACSACLMSLTRCTNQWIWSQQV